ncbi:SdpI family protein [Mycobacterium sp.]|uniref:SdpI family protein n=1 Tax=Mycobacterium sp. TaxID=1785 RepID=UPI002D008DE6|nr:SdpI family protein [Mycobacterium sp.]HTQ21963.1 SdpI family protein [Mycobacterium sp.]
MNGVNAVATYVVVGALWLVAAVSIVTAHCGASGKLPRNQAVGVRTPGTMASDAAWRAGHRAAIPVMWLTVPGAMAGSAALMLTGLGARALGWIPIAVLVPILLAAAVVADKAARRSHSA